MAFLCITQVWADEPFRNHRYDSFQATPVTNQSIVFVGNSITNMQPWAELFTAPNVINRGNSGGFSWEILSNIQSFITGRPAKVFIMIGTNDMNVAGYTPEGVAKNVRQAIKHIQKESPATEVYVESVMPSTNGSRTVAKGQELNSKLKAMAEEMGVHYVDYFDDLMGCTNGTQSYDNLHPHVKGTYAWTKAVAPYVGDGVSPTLPANPTVNNGGQSNSYGARASVFGQLPVTSDDVLFIGDEFVHSGEWQELLGNPNVKNRGTGWGKWGPNVTYQTACVPFILQGLSSNVAPKQVLLMIGTQDLASSSVNKETFQANYKACIDAIRAKAPTTKITLVSEIPYGPSATALNKSNLVPINTWLKETADADPNMDYCDLYSILADENNTAIAKYLNNDQYVTGLGYQACARELAKHIEGCTVMSEADAEAYYNLIAAREVLSNAIDMLEGSSDKSLEPTIESAYALLKNEKSTIAEMEAMGKQILEALRPVPGKWYKMSAMRSTTSFFTKSPSGTGLVASAALDAKGNSYWQLISRDDETYDLKNGAGYYIVPTSTHNVQLNVSTSQPKAGWSLEECDAIGAFNITSKVGTSATDVNCCMNLTSTSMVYNWITGRASDTGCQVVFAEVEYSPEPQPEEETYNVPFQLVNVVDGQFSGAQWWYNIKLKNLNYLYENGTADYMALDRIKTSGDTDEQWAFAGSDQKGYTIYNRKYGTSKVLAAPSTISSDNGKTYVILVDANNIPADYETKWQFAKSADLADIDGYYMYSKDQGSHKVNNYGNLGKLSFWLGGADAGSTLSFDLAEAIIPLTMEGGQFYRGGVPTTTGWVSTWMSNFTEPFQVSFGTSYNNMNAATMGIAVGQSSGPWSFTLSSTDYYVHSYSFKIKGGNADQTITPADGAKVALNTSSFVEINWTNDEKGQKSAMFTYTGTNAESTVSDMVIVVRPALGDVEPETQTNLFEYGSTGNSICYRIPAIATAKNGNVIALTDYRYGGADIGFGRVSLRYRVSKDNGATWGPITTLQESRQGSYGVDVANDLWAGFGDPCVVADRESDRVLAMSCCGNVSYPAGTWAHHQGIARFRSEDGGETWTTFGDPVAGIECHWQDISAPIYQKFKDGGVDVAAMFVGSGRIFQSRFTKVGDYYRLYCVVLLRTATTTGLNYVLYSDDFGDNWNILGGENFTAGVTGGDEPKAEELPDGSIILSSRTYGRIFNIFHFTDVENGLGNWMTQATSNADNSGVRADGNSCNGEIMILPVIRKEDNKKMWLALQSVPFGPGGRYNVGIYYKGLDNYSKFNMPSNFAKDWEGRHQASTISSAYSTMTLQHDNHIGFMYEESTFGKDYTQVYKHYSIEQITDSIYTIDTDPVNPMSITADGIESLLDALKFSKNVGGLGEDAKEDINNAIAEFKSNPTQENYIKIFNIINNLPRTTLDVTKLYIVRNTTRGGDGTNAMYVADDNKLKSKAYNAEDVLQQWAFVPAGEEGYYRIYNTNRKLYIPNLPAKETAIVAVSEEDKAGLYQLVSVEYDKMAMVNKNPKSTYPAIHAPGDYTSRMVAWNTYGSPASLWYIEKTDLDSGVLDAIEGIEVNGETTGTAYDLQGRAVIAPRQGIYIINRKKVILK